ncbi:polysaccharide biosynthesis protein [Microcoleus sp. ARI1-B5]|uniref:polysaccharide biosynthesis protein n=1 Tax=unclassified Microcoleus TaxID=2642155 RepID=UPI002FD6D263
MNRIIRKISKGLLRLRNRHFLLIDTICLAIAPVLALAIRLDDSFTLAPYLYGLAVATVLFVALKLTVFYSFGFYRRYWRYAGIDELAQIAVLIGVALAVEIMLFQELAHLSIFGVNKLPRSLPLLDAMLSFLLIGGIRFSIPAIERLSQRRRKFQRCDRLLIVGAGSAGISLMQKMQRSPQLGLYPAAFIDDDPKKLNLRIRGVSVVGDRHQIPQIVSSLNISKVIIAIPTAPGREIREIVEICQSIGIPTSTLPGINEIINCRISLGSVREVQIEDLLRRESIQTDVEKVSEFIRNKKVLITGAGGSIGSELCRQVLKSAPAEMILVGHGENSVFNIQQELNRVIADLQKAGKIINIPQLTTFIADIRFIDRLEYVFEKIRPDIVFHAAAHKHVPMMELNPPEAITNNVRGTKNLLDLALKYDVEHFVMISTDKAVNPTNIMGASKRVAEMLVLQAAKTSGKPFVVVRFGNVLGSRGSVVPTFKRQIAEGGPITITHPDICRYFMTIPEAVQLLLQAAVLGDGGQVFMLDMGQPVRIVDLAKDLIRLSGYELGKDIDIVFTGLRPGEKLFEELFIPGETYDKTEHEKILILGNASRIVRENIEQEIETLCQAAHRNDGNLIVFLLEQLVPEYIPGYSTVNLHANTAKEKTELAGNSSQVQTNSNSAVSVQVENDLRQALKLEEFRLYYQPIVCLKTHKITAFEALLRWQHPTRGFLAPDEFIPAAEATGLILPIGEWVLRQACSQLRIWQQRFDIDHPLSVSVNLTSKQFFQPDLSEVLYQILTETKLDASSLKIEIPEQVAIDNSELATAVFVKLKALGVQFQIDHCGLSDRSLTRLHRLIRMKYGKFDSLKLDCSVVSGLEDNHANLETLQKIIAIAQELDMGMIATGVETSEQITQLKALKCVYGQGYFFSKPVAGSKVETLIGAMTAKS